MSYNEKNIIASLITTLLILKYFWSRFTDKYSAGVFDGSEGLIALGKFGLTYIAASVIAVIIVTIVLNIAFAIATNDENPSFIVDERDRFISLRGMQIFGVLTGMGIVCSLILLTVGTSIALVMATIMLSFVAGEFLSGIAKLVMHRGWC